MNADTFINAMGMIDDKYLETDIPKKIITKREKTPKVRLTARLMMMEQVK